MYFAVAITAFGIMVCLFSSFVATHFNSLEEDDANYKKNVDESTVKKAQHFD